MSKYVAENNLTNGLMEIKQSMIEINELLINDDELNELVTTTGIFNQSVDDLISELNDQIQYQVDYSY